MFFWSWVPLRDFSGFWLKWIIFNDLWVPLMLRHPFSILKGWWHMVTYQRFLKYTFSNRFIDVSSGLVFATAEWLLFFAESTQSAEETQGSIIKDNPKNIAEMCRFLGSSAVEAPGYVFFSWKPWCWLQFFGELHFKKNLRQLKLEKQRKKHHGQDLSAKKTAVKCKKKLPMAKRIKKQGQFLPGLNFIDPSHEALLLVGSFGVNGTITQQARSDWIRLAGW